MNFYVAQASAGEDLFAVECVSLFVCNFVCYLKRDGKTVTTIVIIVLFHQ